MDNVMALTLLAAVTNDLAAWRRELRGALDYSLLKLSFMVEEDPDYLYRDLPRYGKAFDKGLSSGWFHNPLKRVWFPELLELIFDQNGRVCDLADANAIFFMRQLCYMFKKVNAQCPQHLVNDEVTEFHRIERDMRPYTLNWMEDKLDVNQAISFNDVGIVGVPDSLVRLFGSLANRFASELGRLDPYEIQPRHGPGAVSDRKVGSDKYSFKDWPSKLDGTFPYDYFASPNLLSEIEARNYRNHEHPARLLAVPKTPVKPRLIASEPTYHQYIQGGIMMWLRKKLPKSLRLCMNFRDQGPSRDAALSASKSGLYSTVDLSSASDRLSLWTVERFFVRNPSFLHAVHACRSRYLHDRILTGTYCTLKKYAPQGNATTFPIQSIVYATACITAYLFERRLSLCRKNILKACREVRVFGDDLIVPKDCLVTLYLILSFLGLKVNMSKTHEDGWFRESCGMDAFKGHNVTPVYVNNLRYESTPTSLSSVVDTSNNAMKSGLFSLAVALQDEIFKVSKPSLFPITNGELGCLHLFSFGPERYQSVKVSRTLQRSETLGYQVTSRQKLQKRDNELSLLQYFVEDPAPDSLWESGFGSLHRTKLKVRWVPVRP